MSGLRQGKLTMWSPHSFSVQSITNQLSMISQATGQSAPSNLDAPHCEKNPCQFNNQSTTSGLRQGKLTTQSPHSFLVQSIINQSSMISQATSQSAPSNLDDPL